MPNSNFALTLFPRDSKSIWVDIKDTQLSTLQQTMDHIQKGYPGTVWTEMTIGSNVFQYLVTTTGSVHYLAADTSAVSLSTLKCAMCLWKMCCPCWKPS